MDRRASLQLASVVILLGLGLAALPTQAGNDSWSVAGSPAGGTVMKVVVNPANSSIVYASSGQGLFESTNSGVDWTLIFKTLNGPADFAIDPLKPSTLYLASDENASEVLFKSTDGGATWVARNDGIGGFPGNASSVDQVSVIAVDPVNEGTVYVGTGDTGVYKSTDGGQHWASANTGLSNLPFEGSYITQLAVDPSNPQILFLNDQVDVGGGLPGNTAVAGLYTSVDGGAHWTTTSLTGANMGPFAIDPANGAHVIACGSGSPALSSSVDSGGTWTSTTSCPYGGVSALSIDPSNSLHLLAGTYENGVYQSTDGGVTWTQFSAVTASFIYGAAFDPMTPANLYVGTVSWGLFKSTDGGATWAVSDNGIHDVVPNLMLEGTDEVLYLASAGSGIYKSLDQGVTWTQVGTALNGPGLLGSIYVYGMAEDPKTPSTLYAGTLMDLYKSIDGGNSWTLSDTGMASAPYILAVAVDPENTSTVYVGTQNYGVYKSVDSGASWTSAMSGITDTDVMDIAVDPADSHVVYAGTYAKGLFKSVDGGTTWKPDDTGMSGAGIWAVSVDPGDHKTVYASTGNGIYKSTDAGASWVLSSTGMTGYVMTDIQIDPNNTSIIYVSPRYGIGSAFISTDGGATWNPLTNGLSAAKHSAGARSAQILPLKGMASGTGGGSVFISSVAVDPVHSTQVLGAGNDGQVYVYNDLNPPAGSTGNGSGSGSGSGSGTGPTASGGGAGGGGGGGGAFSLIPMFLLLGLAALRHRRN